MTRRVSVTFEVVGGEVTFERSGSEQVIMRTVNDAGSHASVALAPADFSNLADFFAHPEVNERFDVGANEMSEVETYPCPNLNLSKDDVPF